MNIKKIPAIASLSAGLVALIIVGIQQYWMNIRMELNEILVTLFLSLFGFYIIGCIIQAIVGVQIRKIEEFEEQQRLEQEALEQEQLDVLDRTEESAQSEQPTNSDSF